MTNWKQSHDQAMALAQLALVARARGNPDEAHDLARQALPYERQVADIFAAQSDDALWRAVLYRSAASLAMQCGEWDESERLIEIGLSGNPPAEIAHELEELCADVHKRRRKAEREASKSAAKQPA